MDACHCCHKFASLPRRPAASAPGPASQPAICLWLKGRTWPAPLDRGKQKLHALRRQLQTLRDQCTDPATPILGQRQKPPPPPQESRARSAPPDHASPRVPPPPGCLADSSTAPADNRPP